MPKDAFDSKSPKATLDFKFAPHAPSDASEFEVRCFSAPADPFGWVRSPSKAVTLPFLPEHKLQLVFRPNEVERYQAALALNNLLAVPVSIRPALESAMYRFYLEEMTRGSVNFETPQDQLDWEAAYARRFTNPRHARCPSDMWPLVRFNTVRVFKTSTRLLTGVTGEAAWDGENGIGLYFDGDTRLIAVTAEPETL